MSLGTSGPISARQVTDILTFWSDQKKFRWTKELGKIEGSQKGYGAIFGPENRAIALCDSHRALPVVKMPRVPRANRYIVPGNSYHLTHRCHDRSFLLKFACDRHGYRQRLREAVTQVGLPLLDYNITSNHVHLIVYAEDAEQVGIFMQQVAGESARDYNRRNERSGPKVWGSAVSPSWSNSGNKYAIGKKPKSRWKTEHGFCGRIMDRFSGSKIDP